MPSHWRKVSLVRADPVGDSDEAGEQPHVGVVGFKKFGWRAIREGAENRDELGRDCLAVRVHLRGERFQLEWSDSAALGFAMMSADGDGPRLAVGAAEKFLDEKLADVGVVRFGTAACAGECNVAAREFIEGLSSQPRGAFALKAERDFTDVVQRGEKGGAGREKRGDGSGQLSQEVFADAADV